MMKLLETPLMSLIMALIFNRLMLISKGFLIRMLLAPAGHAAWQRTLLTVAMWGSGILSIVCVLVFIYKIVKS